MTRAPVRRTLEGTPTPHEQLAESDARRVVKGDEWRWVMRTGNEPLQARSPLRMRRGFALWGMFWAAAGTVAFVLAGRPGWAAACAVVTALAATDLAMVIRRIRQGPHYQPGKDVPPYEPDHGSGTGPPRPGPPDRGRGGRPPDGHDTGNRGRDHPDADGNEDDNGKGGSRGRIGDGR
ncbi:DUF6343 family protein [Streptomyces chrestomyceticus]|uniref:DUF6343 family protein n=2 Tax=Streptomyces chrestomyceticus TaxID=68185 RepID=UPI0033E94F20